MEPTARGSGEYAERIVRLLQSGKRCGLTFDAAWTRAIDVVGVKHTWHRPGELTLFGEAKSELTPLEFLHERCRAEWLAVAGPRFRLTDLLEALSDGSTQAQARSRRSHPPGRLESGASREGVGEVGCSPHTVGAPPGFPPRRRTSSGRHGRIPPR